MESNQRNGIGYEERETSLLQMRIVHVTYGFASRMWCSGYEGIQTIRHEEMTTEATPIDAICGEAIYDRTDYGSF